MDVTETDMKKVEAFYRGTKALCNLADAKIIPVLKGILQQNDFDQALIVTYYRMQFWLQALERLDDPRHFQTVLNAARAVYELLLDLKLLKADPSYIHKYHAFPGVARFYAAEVYTRELKKYPGCAPPVKSILRQTHISDAVQRKEYDQALRTHWPGSKRAPDHWSGLGMADRATKLGPEEAIRYRYVYPSCSPDERTWSFAKAKPVLNAGPVHPIEKELGRFVRRVRSENGLCASLP